MTHRVVNYTYGTGNPVLPDGSIDVRDGIDNLQSFDVLMNAPEDTYNRRDGDIVQTVAGALKSTGFKPGSGDFTTGFTVLHGQYNISWYDPVSKNWYSYLGVIPTGGYGVAPGTNPVGSSLWKPVTDKLLRSELSGEDGSEMVGHNSSTVSEMLDSLSVSSKSELEAILASETGLFVRVKSDYGTDHIRVLSATSDATSILTAGGLYANLHVTVPNTIYMSQLFWDAGSNQTAAITGGMSTFVDANKIRSIVLDVGDIYISTTLPDAFNDVVFSGTGKLLTGSINNVMQRVGTELSPRQYHGDYNNSMIFGESFKNAVMKRKEVRVVLMGDSISVGSDYDSFNSIPAGARASMGVDNEDRHNCLAATIFAEIVAMVPSDCRVRFYSRSIGGRVYAQLNQAWDNLGALWSGREAVTAGKAWRNCVLDLNPDLVIHSLGMNESPQSYYDGFINNWVNYINTASLLRSTTFDQAVLTTPNPNFITTTTSAGDFRDYTKNADRFYIAGLQRTLSRRYGYSLIDVAFNSTLKRYGFDPRGVTFEKSSTAKFTDGSTTKVLSVGMPVSDSTLSADDLPMYSSSEFIISSPSASSVGTFDFRFNAGNVAVQLNAGSLTVFASAVGGSGLIGEKVIVPYLLPANTQTEFVVTITPQSIYVYAAGNLVATLHNPTITGTLPLIFNNSVNAFSVTVHSVNISSGLFPRYSQDSKTNGDFYGELAFANNPFGGGVNHPSSTMLNEVYIPPVREFFEKAMSSHVEYTNIIGGTSANEVVYIGRVLSKRYNRVRVYEYGSLRETIFTIAADGSATVIKNTGGTVSMYFDSTDGALFLKNTTASVLQFEISGEWVNVRPLKLGVTSTPRGTLLATVA